MKKKIARAGATTTRARRYNDLAALRPALLAKCREDWKKRTGREWDDAIARQLSDELELDVAPIMRAQAAIVDVFENVARVVETWPADDRRVAPLRDFVATLSEKTVGWVRLFGELRDGGRAAIARAKGMRAAPPTRDDARPDNRTLIALCEMNEGRGEDAGQLARISLLLGGLPLGIKYPTLVSTVIDLERRLMFKARARARLWLAQREFERRAAVSTR